MDSAVVPAPLVRRLGEDGTDGLLTLLDSAREQWTEATVTMAVDRFERRLTQEMSALRVEVARELAAVRTDVGRDIGSLRAELARDLATLRSDLAASRVEQLKWSFGFWAGQVAVTGGVLALVLRLLR